jgi:branched-chain amino acid transport system permease protein
MQNGQRNRSKIIATGAVVLVLAVLPKVLTQDYLIDLCVLIFLAIILSQSWNLLAGFTGQVSLGHAAFFGLGASTCRFLWKAGTLYPIALLAGGIVATIAALIVAVPAFRLRGFYFAIGTLALGEALLVIVSNLFAAVDDLPIEYIASYSLASRYYVALIVALIATIISYAVVNSKTGLGMMAVRDDEEAAAHSGVSPLKQKIIAVTLSAFLAGLAGGVLAYYHVAYYYTLPFSTRWSVEAMLIAVVGGTGTIIGPIVGGVLFIALQYVFSILFGKMHVLIFGVIFVLVVLICPGGVVEALGRLQRSRRSSGQSLIRNRSNQST